MDQSEIPRLEKRNVEVFESIRGVVIAGFWQNGTVQWDEFLRYLTECIVSSGPWSVFHYDLTQQQHGAKCPSGAEIVQPGRYIMLSSAGEPMRIGLDVLLPRSINVPAREYHDHYRMRGWSRDGKCLITGLRSETYSRRLQVVHIFSREHDAEWVREGYPSKITDTADDDAMGGPTKIDSVQNLITLRSDLRDAWDNYEFGVDPNNNYRITCFTNGNKDINGLYLQLDHIQNPTLRPLDELFTDHFTQGLLKYIKGAGEPEWSPQDDDDDEA